NLSITSNDTNLNTAITNNYKKNTKIYGDGIYETSTAGIGTTSWYGDLSYYLGLDYPFSVRGGALLDNTGAGLFSFHRNVGNNIYYNGFRVTLIVS
ncbi:MAG: hypothetical protein ACLTEH_04650, partial [Clostridia bacterium]